MQHITQLHYGRQARYGLCIDPACPTRTPKTLARRDAHIEEVPQTTIAAASTQRTLAGVPVGTSAANESDLSDVTELAVYFAPGSSRLDRTAQQILQQFLTLVPPASHIRIAGRTDSTGTPALNDAIAHQRATRVERYLRRHLHIPAVQLEVGSSGACCYAAANATETGRQNNRRVELSLTADAPRQVPR
ncbi:OmpA family protein [Janthinobacterium sp. NKUCC06_STL]|uniref:OmpA family protein n=1 Tax=Janthinobacterium sp. NKUCC06_STL TaxID=2842127 RepID=UPI001C5B69E2|nr:OmpA family protein [Janthinobacterium sp. NKUCC06_STL]MBW3510568.1 OmpA family protein [Janthinobacterium sp. NKUCC06_STL]